MSISFYGQDLYWSDSPGWKPFSHFLEENTLVPIGDPTAEYFIAFEHNSRHSRLAGRVLSKNRCFLVIFEPKAVNPLQFSTRVHSKYRMVLVPSKLQVKGPEDVSYDAGGLPTREVAVLDLETNHAINLREPRSTLIQQNKFSFVRGSGYTLRWDIISAFDKHRLPLLVAGKNWDRPLGWWLIQQAYAFLVSLKGRTRPNLRLVRLPRKLDSVIRVGEVPDSVDFQRSGTFSLVVENDREYVSEKFFNALLAGAVPIYFGADLSEFGIPETIYISVTSPNASEFLSAVTNTPPSAVWAIAQAGQEWLADETNWQRWEIAKGHGRVVALLTEAIKSDYYLGAFPPTPS